MDRLSDLLASYLAQRGMKDQADALPVLSKASAWICDRLPAHTDSLHAKTFKDGILIITADNEAASKEMVSISSDLRLYLLEYMPESRIASVRVIQG